MNRYHLVHTTQFSYDGLVSESYNQVRLRPMQDDRQTCVSFRLRTTPGSRWTAFQDALGNWVHQFNVLAEHKHLTVEAESVVLAHDTPPPAIDEMRLEELAGKREELFEEHFDFLAASNYVPHLPQIEELVEAAEAAGDGTVSGFAQAASDLIHKRFSYVKGATHVHSSIEDSLSRKAGVCQDFAHVMLGVVRKRGLPGRYVSGYLVPESAAVPGAKLEEVIGGHASHAWTEVFLPNAGWTAFDPTLGEAVGLRHVRIAYGRDYGDVAPVRGIYKGRSGQRLSVDVTVRPELDEDGHEQMSRSPETPAEDTQVSQRPQQPAQQQQ